MVVRYAQRLLIEVAVVCSGSSLAAQCFAPDPALDTGRTAGCRTGHQR
jgi:hypothetical protein